MKHYLAFDGGGTGTRAGLYDARGNLAAEAAGEASNPVALGPYRCLSALTKLGRRLTGPAEARVAAVGAAISGACGSRMAGWLADGLRARFNAERAIVADDIRPVLFANIEDRPGALAIAGTGSSVVAQCPDGRSEIIGGRGAVFGDEGSAYQIGQSALRIAGRALDGLGPDTALVETLPHAAGVGHFHMLILWARDASMRDIAALAPAVAETAEYDAPAAACIAEQARRLAEHVNAAFVRLELERDAPVFLNGSLFEKCPRYLEAFRDHLAGLGLTSEPVVAPIRGHRAALAMATAETLPATLYAAESSGERPAHRPSSTEERPPAPPLDALTPEEMVAAMNREDATVADAVAPTADMVAEAARRCAEALEAGGRMIYVGAGTSGRLGVLDASECPPTFGVDPDRVVGIIAGGDEALRRSIEGAEDDGEAAVRDLEALVPPVEARDMVIGIAASGTTPYTLAALRHAAERGATTALLCCNPDVQWAPGLTIAVDTGPEVVMGSTRLKAGTACKLVLNTLSTAAMALTGRVFEGLMVGMGPTNVKLHRRSIIMLRILEGVSEAEAEALLQGSDGDIRTAVLMHRTGAPAGKAAALLDKAGGNLRAALENRGMSTGNKG